MSFEELWYSSSGKPLQLYFFDEESSLTDGQCGSFLGDGICNSDFNTPEYDYDEGDCCASTCTDTFCGIGTLTDVFNTSIASGNGYPNCADPTMKPITILLNDVYLPPPTAENVFTNAQLQTRQPLMILDCDGKNIFMVSIDENMKNKTETVLVADGANCVMMVTNTTLGSTDAILYVNYTVFHGDKSSIYSDPVVMAQGDSSIESVAYFRRIDECILTKLKDHINTTTVYTGAAPANHAIRWLMKDSKGYSSCERDEFMERYALTVINFAAPIVNGNARNDMIVSNTENEGLWITTGRHCIWRAVGCVGSVVTELNYKALSEAFVSGTIPSEIALLKNLTAISMSKWNIQTWAIDV